MSDFVDFYPYFLNQLLQTANSIPIQSQWLIVIEKLPALGMHTSLDEKVEGDWDLYNSMAINTQAAYHTRKGCLFAQSVNIPGDGLDVAQYGSDQTTYLKGWITNSRSGFEKLMTVFLETDVSFTDFILRPWMIVAGRKSLKKDTLKTTITVYNLTKGRSGMTPRKIITYHGCTPVKIDTEEYNYTGNKVIERQVQWSYNYYEISDGECKSSHVVPITVEDIKIRAPQAFPGTGIFSAFGADTEFGRSFGKLTETSTNILKDGLSLKTISNVKDAVLAGKETIQSGKNAINKTVEPIREAIEDVKVIKNTINTTKTNILGDVNRLENEVSLTKDLFTKDIGGLVTTLNGPVPTADDAIQRSKSIAASTGAIKSYDPNKTDSPTFLQIDKSSPSISKSLGDSPNNVKQQNSPAASTGTDMPGFDVSDVKTISVNQIPVTIIKLTTKGT